MRNPIAWLAAAASAIAAVLAFGVVPLSWALPPLVFVSVASALDARRLHRAWLARQRGLRPEASRDCGDIEQDDSDLLTLRRPQEALAETSRLASVALDVSAHSGDSPSGTLDPSAGLTFLAENPERDPAAPKRRTRRMPQEMLFCNLGQVLDLSRGGMRIRLGRTQFPEGVVKAEIHAPDGPLHVTAELIWTKIDNRTRDAGFRFVDLPPESAHRITAICMQHRCRTTMADRSET